MPVRDHLLRTARPRPMRPTGDGPRNALLNDDLGALAGLFGPKTDQGMVVRAEGAGMLEESGSSGWLVSLVTLGVPGSYRAMKSADRVSAQTAVNKGVYAQNYADTSSAKQYSRVKADDKKSTAPPVPAPAPAKAAAQS